tara:strand:+ start:71 stop:469 length:399 start_codon:yes stop_codon:yes gene_type:complete
MAILKPTRLYKDIDLSFSQNPNTKDVNKKIDVQAVKQAIKILVNTQFYERPFNPKFGSQVRALLFDLMDEQTARILATTLQLAIENFEPRAKVEDIICRPNFEQNSYDIQILFFVVGVREQQSLELVLERLR